MVPIINKNKELAKNLLYYIAHGEGISENNNLQIVDRNTIKEFFTFILINNKYQADENCHDDMIMSLALIFVPFCNSKNFEDMKNLIKNSMR